MKRSFTQTLNEGFKSLDKCPETVQFTVEGGQTKFKTKTGAIGTIMMLIAVLGFGLKRYVDMNKYVNAQVSVNELSDYYSPEF